MQRVRLVAAGLLALPLIVFGANHFLGFIDVKSEDASAGHALLQTMKDGGLMGPIALSHIAIGVLLLVPRTRFAAALLQLPISIGILSFHLTMLPEGTPMAAVLLLLNALVAWDPPQLQSLLAARPPPDA